MVESTWRSSPSSLQPAYLISLLPPHTPEHNGVSERKHRHIVETGLSLLSHAGMPRSYWTYAFSTVVYLINRLPTPVLNMTSPFAKLFGTTPNFDKLKIFGCLCFPWLRPYSTHKLDNRSTPCVFLGYSTSQSAYLCLQPTTRRIYVSRHVQFDEQVFPFPRSSKPRASSEPNSPQQNEPLHSLIPLRPPLADSTVPSLGTPRIASPPPVTSENSDGGVVRETQSGMIPNSNLSNQTGPLPLNQTNPSPYTQNNSSPNLNQRSPQPSQAQPENLTTNPLGPTTNPSSQPSSSSSLPPEPAPIIANKHPMTTRQKNNISKPKTKLNLSARYTNNYPPEPRTVNQALLDKRWRGSMSTELDAFARNQTYELVPRQAHQNIIGCRWIYTNKFFADGSDKCC